MTHELQTGHGTTLVLHDLEPTPADLRREATLGLRAPRKHLACKFFYDDAGARLFEQICRLEAYYPTRTELSILTRALPELARMMGPAARVIEPGSGSGDKTLLLLNALERPASYVPIDISRAQLIEFAIELGRTFPNLLIQPVCADYTEDFTLPPIETLVDRTVVFFPGSTIGNFEPVEAARFLRRMHQHTGENGGMLIGVDLRKDAATLECAYDDPEGVTAAFNKNLLARINRECGADFNLEAFQHRAVYDEQNGRVEMQLVSTRWQLVTFPASGSDAEAHIEFEPGEYIVTEHCYKYTIEGFQSLAREAGFHDAQVWTDAQSRFSLHWLESGFGEAQPPR